MRTALIMGQECIPDGQKQETFMNPTYRHVGQESEGDLESGVVFR